MGDGGNRLSVGEGRDEDEVGGVVEEPGRAELPGVLMLWNWVTGLGSGEKNWEIGSDGAGDT